MAPLIKFYFSIVNYLCVCEEVLLKFIYLSEEKKCRKSMQWFNSPFVTQTFSFLACKIGNWTSMKWLGYDQQFSMHKVISYLKYTEDHLALYKPNFPTDAVESNLCSVWVMLSIISIPTALLYLHVEIACSKSFSSFIITPWGTALLSCKGTGFAFQSSRVWPYIVSSYHMVWLLSVWPQPGVIMYYIWNKMQTSVLNKTTRQMHNFTLF